MGGMGGGVRPPFLDEDRGRDWHCPMCKERNFAKRPECFKCRTAKPNETKAQQHKPPPKDGTTLNGMVKSYNKKGFGFIMCTNYEEPDSDWAQDIYYMRESVSSRLLHPDMPGEHVTFEIYREGRRIVARNIRPLGESLADSRRPANGSSRGFAATYSAAGQKSGYKPGEEDRTHDWICPGCKERNFVKRFECFRCKMPRPIDPKTHGFSDGPPQPSFSSSQKRSFSPHAGARAIREALAKERAAAAANDDKDSDSSSPRRKRRKKGKKKKSSSSSSSSSRSKKKKDKKKHKKKKSSSSSSSDDASSDCKVEESDSAAASGNPEIDAAKSDALERLMKLRSVEPKETRMAEWRALLREWHPDKNPERIEVATAVFQFLQKGKTLLDQSA